jgi:hypothetical protein
MLQGCLPGSKTAKQSGDTRICCGEIFATALLRKYYCFNLPCKPLIAYTNTSSNEKILHFTHIINVIVGRIGPT